MISPTAIRRFAPKAAAGYSQKTSGIYVRNQQYAGNEHVIAHELTHALTLDAVQNPTKAQKPAVKRLDNLYRYESSNARRNAQANLWGRSHYVDDATLRYHHARVLSSRHIFEGRLFYIIESCSADYHHTQIGRAHV